MQILKNVRVFISMNSKIKFIALSALASAMAFTSVASQAAVNGSLKVKFQSSITATSCEVGVIDEDGSINRSNTIILPSLTSTQAAGVDSGVVGTAVNFSIGPLNPVECAKVATSYDVVATGDQVTTDVLRNLYGSGPANMGVEMKLASGGSILDIPLMDQDIASADDTIIHFKSQLFHLDNQPVTEGLIGSVATVTTAYY